MNMRQAVITVVIGIALGAAGAVYLPGMLRPYLPGALGGRTVIARGLVVAKEKKPSALLLTVNTSEGASLATFTRRVDETDLLINKGDSVEIRTAGYSPFIEDPEIARVVKGDTAPPGPENAALSATTRTGSGETKPPKPASSAPSKKTPRQEQVGERP